jgi:hypothetical protein
MTGAQWGRLAAYLFVAAIILAMMAFPVLAQQNCAERAVVIQRLTEAYGEGQLGAGLQQNTIVEVWVSDETGTWSALQTRPDGTSCIVASGTDWRAGEIKPAGVPG